MSSYNYTPPYGAGADEQEAAALLEQLRGTTPKTKGPLYDPIKGAYSEFLGREPGEDEWRVHLGNPGGLAGAIETIRDSPEAKAYSAQPKAIEAPGAAASAAAFRAGSGGNLAGSFAGFDFGQAESNRDVNKSAKYAFADLASASGVLPRTKAEAQDWFLRYIAPEFEKLGYKVYSVTGDKAIIGTRENPGGEEIDFLQGANGDDPRFAWQSSAAGAPAPPVASGAPGAPGGLPGLAAPDLTSPEFYQQVLAEVTALAKGQPSKLNAQALLSMLKG